MLPTTDALHVSPQTLHLYASGLYALQGLAVLLVVCSSLPSGVSIADMVGARAHGDT